MGFSGQIFEKSPIYQITCSQRTDRRDEANGRFSQIANAHESQVTNTGVCRAPADSEV